jgi:peptidoglycan-associated lipoprotein
MRKIGRMAGAGALVLALAACGTPPGPSIYKGPVVAATDACSDLTASIYFARDSAALTRDGKAVLQGAAAQAESCNFRDVEIYGLSDPVGAPAANVALSKRRAEVVTAELARLGFAEVTFKLVAAGETGAVMPTGEVEPLRRRVDIIFGAR